MVRTGLVKSLNIFKSSLNENNFRLNKKHVLRKGMIESTAIHKFSLVITKLFFFMTSMSLVSA